MFTWGYGNDGQLANNEYKGRYVHIHVAVTGRKRTLFLSYFDHFFQLCNNITLSIVVPESSNLISSNSYLSAKSIPNSGLKLQSMLAADLYVFYL